MGRTALLSTKPSFGIKHRQMDYALFGISCLHLKCPPATRSGWEHPWSSGFRLPHQLLWGGHRWMSFENCASHTKKVLFLLSLSSEKQNYRIRNDLDNVSSLNSRLLMGPCEMAMSWFFSFSWEGYGFQCLLAICHSISQTISRHPQKSPSTSRILAFLSHLRNCLYYERFRRKEVGTPTFIVVPMLWEEPETLAPKTTWWRLMSWWCPGDDSSEGAQMLAKWVESTLEEKAKLNYVISKM